jgi:hypothetical protein
MALHARMWRCDQGPVGLLAAAHIQKDPVEVGQRLARTKPLVDDRVRVSDDVCSTYYLSEIEGEVRVGRAVHSRRDDGRRIHVAAHRRRGVDRSGEVGRADAGPVSNDSGITSMRRWSLADIRCVNHVWMKER